MLQVLEFAFSSFWVYCGITYWLMLGVGAAHALGCGIGGKKP